MLKGQIVALHAGKTWNKCLTLQPGYKSSSLLFRPFHMKITSERADNGLISPIHSHCFNYISCRHAIMSSCHHVIMSYCHPDILFYCHLVILWLCPHWYHYHQYRYYRNQRAQTTSKHEFLLLTSSRHICLSVCSSSGVLLGIYGILLDSIGSVGFFRTL